MVFLRALEYGSSLKCPSLCTDSPVGLIIQLYTIIYIYIHIVHTNCLTVLTDKNPHCLILLSSSVTVLFFYLFVLCVCPYHVISCTVCVCVHTLGYGNGILFPDLFVEMTKNNLEAEVDLVVYTSPHTRCRTHIWSQSPVFCTDEETQPPHYLSVNSVLAQHDAEGSVKKSLPPRLLVT